MRGLVLLAVFFALLPLVFKRPYIGILMWFWISLMNPHRLVYGFAADLSYAMIVAIVTLASWLLFHPEERKAPPADRMTFLIVAMMIWISITSLSAGGFPSDVLRIWSDAEKMLLMTLVAYIMTNTRERFDQLVLVCVLSLAFYGFRGGVFTVLTGGGSRVLGPTGTMIADNNDLGVSLTMILPLLFYLQYRYAQPYLKWPMRILIGFTAIGCLFTYSRGALLAMLAMASTLWLRARHKIAVGAMIVVAVAGVLYSAPEEWFDRMHTIRTYHEDGSAQGRLYYWQLSWNIALKYPVTGAGFRWMFNPAWVNRELAGSGLPPLNRPRAPHSIWFETLGNHGFVGLSLFVLFFVVAVMDARWLIRQTRDRPDLAWANHFGRMLQVSIVGFAVGGSFVTLGMYDGFYALVIMGAAARRIVAAELAAEGRTRDAPLAGVPAPAAAAPAPVFNRPVIRKSS
jgi:probable O-glycosylation ligase (exosortase A-associated)